jgi:hypothetical protein
VRADADGARKLVRRANLLDGDGEPRGQHLHDEFVDARRERRVLRFETPQRRQREPQELRCQRRDLIDTPPTARPASRGSPAAL